MISGLYGSYNFYVHIFVKHHILRFHVPVHNFHLSQVSKCFYDLSSEQLYDLYVQLMVFFYQIGKVSIAAVLKNKVQISRVL